MSIEDWDLNLDTLTGYRHDSEGNLIAWVVPDSMALSDWGGPAFKWGTGSEQGHSKSLASGTARADRQLRIEGQLPLLESKKATVPRCGHIDCIELMGCAANASRQHGLAPETRDYLPGAAVRLDRVSSTGNSVLDYIWSPA